MVRRAHLVISFLAHFYLHSQPTITRQPTQHWASRWLFPDWNRSFQQSRYAEADEDEISSREEALGQHLDEIPASLSRPWVQASRILGVPPILTYATTVLWNWALIDPTQGVSPQNVRILETFTDTESERHFYLTSLLIEMRGVEALGLMRRSLDEIFLDDSLSTQRVTSYLSKLMTVINDLTQLLANVKTNCTPEIFYWDIRPWFRGADASLAGRGWLYAGVGSQDTRRHLSGPSAGQSTLIHALDIFLSVDHSVRTTRDKQESEAAKSSAKKDATFMERMSFYMPQHHRQFLNHLQNITLVRSDDTEDSQEITRDDSLNSVRGFVLAHIESDHRLSQSYNDALSALKLLRDEHMRVAALYIISQARRPRPMAKQQVPIPASADTEELRGTGGTDLVRFLKACRSNTTAALLSVAHP